MKAVDTLSLSFGKGEFTALSGPSGSGKTTTLNMIGALDVPSSGRVEVEGTDIATPMKMSGAFPPTVSYMVGVGEQAGNLEEMLERISGTYDEEVDLATQKLTSVLEPLIIVFMGITSGGIAFAILMPLLQINEFVQ